MTEETIDAKNEEDDERSWNSGSDNSTIEQPLFQKSSNKNKWKNKVLARPEEITKVDNNVDVHPVIDGFGGFRE